MTLREETLQRVLVIGLAAWCLAQPVAVGQDAVPETSRGDAMIAEYFRAETERLTDDCLADIKSWDDWLARRHEYRRQLFEMLGLDPLPEKTPLGPVVIGTVKHPEFTVEKVHFQSRPGLYVTGNLYVPQGLDGPVPTILYVCGHGRVKQDGVSFGNKVHYHHHGAWFARHGYVCLSIDTLQLGEIEGIHHGTYRHDRWWWNARGYTPAGVEAWNCIRALDYLQTRPEVDAERIGVTGRSGGGAYSWWIAALDDRIKVAVPVAGITSLKNHVVDGCVEGHCDCMYQVNTYRWDFPQVAALVAPRPLLISNSDKDRIFPLDGVVDVYNEVRRIYELAGAVENVGLNITEGPHSDTQQLRTSAFHWMNRFLAEHDPLIERPAVKFFQPEQLKVFDTLPHDERNTKIDESFTQQAEPPALSVSSSDWESQRDAWISDLREKSFGGWPDETSQAAAPAEVFSVEHDGVQFSAYDFQTQRHIGLRLYVAHRAGLQSSDLELVVLNALDEEDWIEFLEAMQVGFPEQLAAEQLPAADADGFREMQQMFARFKWGMAYVAPRGVGPTAWDQDARKQIQIRRRFMLLGQTLDGMRVWDVRRAAQTLRAIPGMQDVPLWMQGEREMAGVVLYASLFEPDVKRLDLWHLPGSHRDGPVFLNVLRILDTPQAVALAAERSDVRIYQTGNEGWEYPRSVVDSLGLGEKRLQTRSIPGGQAGEGE